MPRVTVISGPPLAGKTTYVAENRGPNDLVVDWDAIAVALGSPVTHGHPRSMWPYIAAARDAIYQRIRRGYDGQAWIITSNPQLAEQWPGCTHVRLEVDQAEAHKRAGAAGRPASYHANIDDWWRTRGGEPAPAQRRTRNGSQAGWRKKRARILRQSDICWICGQPGADSVDHVIPWSISHDDSDENLRPAHHNVPPHCNRTKGDRIHAPTVKRSGALA